VNELERGRNLVFRFSWAESVQRDVVQDLNTMYWRLGVKWEKSDAAKAPSYPDIDQSEFVSA
jgi:hypothetical protein